MRVVDILIAVLMAPLGLALGSAAVLALAPLPVTPWLSGFLLIVAVVAVDMLVELRGDALWSVMPDWVQKNTRRARRIGRNLFLIGFVTGVILRLLTS
jgi:hypothetical protein